MRIALKMSIAGLNIGVNDWETLAFKAETGSRTSICLLLSFGLKSRKSMKNGRKNIKSLSFFIHRHSLPSENMPAGSNINKNIETVMVVRQLLGTFSPLEHFCWKNKVDLTLRSGHIEVNLKNGWWLQQEGRRPLFFDLSPLLRLLLAYSLPSLLPDNACHSIRSIRIGLHLFKRELMSLGPIKNTTSVKMTILLIHMYNIYGHCAMTDQQMIPKKENI